MWRILFWQILKWLPKCAETQFISFKNLSLLLKSSCVENCLVMFCNFLLNNCIWNSCNYCWAIKAIQIAFCNFYRNHIVFISITNALLLMQLSLQKKVKHRNFCHTIAVAIAVYELLLLWKAIFVFSFMVAMISTIE